MCRSIVRFFTEFLIFLVLMGFFHPARAQEPNAPSTESLQGLVNLMENPEKREAFVKDLKNLIETKKKLEQESGKKDAENLRKEGRPLAVVRYAFDQFDNLSKYSQKQCGCKHPRCGPNTPDYWEVQRFLRSWGKSHPPVHPLPCRLGGYLDRIVCGPASPAHCAENNGKGEGFTTLLFWGGVRVTLNVTPYACLWFFFSLLSNLFPSFSEGTNLLILFFSLLFLYRGTMAVFRMLLSPDESRLRLLPLEDETANYLFIWARRFALYLSFISWRRACSSGRIRQRHCIRRFAPFSSWDSPLC